MTPDIPRRTHLSGAQNFWAGQQAVSTSLGIAANRYRALAFASVLSPSA
jgi:hypothetical protein